LLLMWLVTVKEKKSKIRTCEASKMEMLRHWNHSLKTHRVTVDPVVVFLGGL